MSPVKRKGFFGEAPPRPEDQQARKEDVEALIAPRRTVVQDLPVERITANPFQARKQFDDLEELADAIRAQGFTSRLRVRPDPFREGYFQLVYGERRLKAAVLAGWSAVPSEIAEHSDEEMVEIGLAENIQRRDLSPMEEARAFQTFIRERGYTIRSLAQRIGKDKSYVDDRLSLLRIPEDLQEMVNRRSDTIRAARELAKLATPAEREPLIQGVLEGSLNVQDVRAIVAGSTAEPEEHEGEDQGPVTADGDAEAGFNPAARPGPASPKKQGRKREPNLEHSIERDGRMLLSIAARWHSALPELNEQQKALLLFYIEQVAPEFNSLKKSLKQKN